MPATGAQRGRGGLWIGTTCRGLRTINYGHPAHGERFAADYLRFCEMLRCGGMLDGERIIGRHTLALMTRNHLAGGSDLSRMAVGAFSETAYEGTGFGLGFAMTLSEVATGNLGEGDYFWGGAASTIF